ncbi:EscU/YscU/HrcU family type III secretion system export apparatus switch protein [Metabacillus sp. 113a]|uniref:EscU/YscU/HrcU family type III secretion system export apparatus switch protein n=1 Tax=Metabacillus sp. 113a TaxID=3404706 RepID=UPI003CE6AFCD
MNDSSKRKAAALKYENGSQKAPRVTAKGQGLIADEIISRAIKAGVPVKEDPSLATLLHTLEIQQEIPEELYTVVAEIFAYLYELDRSAGDSKAKHSKET